MTTAYNRIDRFLRKNLNDDNYSSYKDELDAICQAKIQRTWIELTDEEIVKIVNANSSKGLYLMAKAIEAKSKERNGYSI